MIHDDIIILSVTYYPTRFCKQVFLLTERFNVSLHELEFVTSLAPRSSCHVTIVAQIDGLYVLLELVPATITPDGKKLLAMTNSTSELFIRIQTSMTPRSKIRYPLMCNNH